MEKYLEGDLLSKLKQITSFRSGMGIVEKINGVYIRSHPDFLRELEHGDRVICIKIDDFYGMTGGINELMDIIAKLFFKSILNLEIKNKIRIRELKHELKELEKD